MPPGSVHICHFDSGTCCLCSHLATAAPGSVHIFHCDFGPWCPWQCSHLSRHTLNLAPAAPSSVHIFHCDFGTWCPWQRSHLSRLTLNLAPAAPGSVFASGTWCSWRCSHLLLWLWHLLHLAVFTLVSMTLAPDAHALHHLSLAVHCLCSLLQLLMLLTACVVMRVAQRWTNHLIWSKSL